MENKTVKRHPGVARLSLPQQFQSWQEQGALQAPHCQRCLIPTPNPCPLHLSPNQIALFTETHNMQLCMHAHTFLHTCRHKHNHISQNTSLQSERTQNYLLYNLLSNTEINMYLTVMFCVSIYHVILLFLYRNMYVCSHSSSHIIPILLCYNEKQQQLFMLQIQKKKPCEKLTQFSTA